jgi:fatty acid desaturase
MVDTDRTGGAFDAVSKGELRNGKGVRYRDFRRQLTPKYALVWLHLSAGYLALAATGLTAVVLGVHFPSLRLPLVAAGALAFGYTIAYIVLFFHEAAHYNLAPSRRVNDVLANLVIGSLIGQDIAAYRRIHFDHHRYLGSPLDTESTYFDPLDVRFVVESLFGVKAVRVVVRREARARSAEPDGDPTPGGRRTQAALGIALHGLVAGGAWLLGGWYVGLAWAVGVVMVAPFFYAVRQVLEHRDDAADKDLDYRRTPHGPVNRLFGTGPLASTLGGAGFNRHLLHHWEPQISYTRLPEVERFLLETDVADAVRARTTTYLRTFRRLFAP